MFTQRLSMVLAASALLLSSLPMVASATTVIPVDTSVMTSSFFQGTNRVRGYPEDNRRVLRASNDGAGGLAFGETIYLGFTAFDFTTLSGQVQATLTMQSVAGGFSLDASASSPFLVSIHAVSANPFTQITDDTNPAGPISWSSFYSNNILPSVPAARTLVSGFGAVSFDVSSVVNDWRSGSNNIYALAVTGLDDTSSADFLHGFLNDSETLGSTFLTVTAVPEPSAVVLMMLGGTVLVVARRRSSLREPTSSAAH